ncbi:putative metal-binding motif-containing protein [Myxococcota bacterium]|nr:putative metal-binding motif-containing protein [Myxococcota bacterium]
MMLPALLLSLSLIACGDKDDDDGDTSDGGAMDGGGTDGGGTDGGGTDGGGTDGGGTDGGGDGGTTDLDGDDDGWTVADGDCDDADPAVHPGAADEPYDGLDSDCDGVSDFDWDGDGFDSDAYGGDDCDDADASVHPGAPDDPYDGQDDDCAGGSDFDADGDGEDAEGWGGGDCDDADADVHPGAYDRPNDDLDQDCDGEDRSFDGAVVDEGAVVTYEIVVPLDGYGQVDVAVLLDTTCSMSTALSSLDFSDIAAEVEDVDVELGFAFATFDDYNYGTFGSAVDRPFELHQQVTTDLDLMAEAVADAGIHSGSDGPESAIEGLYQLLGGHGYDQDCDEDYDSTTDVRPFLASADDPFEGDGGESCDLDSALGTLGGAGFRVGATPVVYYITDNYMRDADGLVSAYDDTPGGCPTDAGTDGVLEEVDALGALLVGVATASLPVDGMEELADLSGSYLDLDGDGESEPMVLTWNGREPLGTTIGASLAAVLGEVAIGRVLESVSLQPTLDAYGLISDISPDPASDVDTTDVDSVTFTLTLEGTVPATTEVLDVTLMLDLVIEGEVVDTITVAVEIPPA